MEEKNLSSLNESSLNNPEDLHNYYKKQPSPNKTEKFSDRMIVKTGQVSAGKVEPVDGYNVSKKSENATENNNFNKITRTIVGLSNTKA